MVFAGIAVFVVLPVLVWRMSPGALPQSVLRSRPGAASAMAWRESEEPPSIVKKVWTTLHEESCGEECIIDISRCRVENTSTCLVETGPIRIPLGVMDASEEERYPGYSNYVNVQAYLSSASSDPAQVWRLEDVSGVLNLNAVQWRNGERPQPKPGREYLRVVDPLWTIQGLAPGAWVELTVKTLSSGCDAETWRPEDGAEP